MSTVVYGQDVFGDRFVNNALTAVIDSLCGLVCSNPDVGLLDFGKVVVRRDYAAEDVVKVLSGGASGHEPAFAGFVGKGMLTAAVQGDVFCSPHMTDILRTIKEISFKQISGVLIIIQNNTSDRLNFGLAAERARGQNIEVKMIVVSDDCIVTNSQQGRRGLAGVVLLHKIAGAMSENKLDLDNIYQLCQNVNQNMCSILLSLQPCTSLTMETCVCAKQATSKEMELGAGLQGEPGLMRMERSTVADACCMLIEEMSKTFVLDVSVPVAILINNLGNTLQVEELIFTKEFISQLQGKGISIARVYRGQFLTSLDMRGFSATVLKITDPKVLEYLDSPCEAFSWGRKNFKEIPTNVQDRIPARVKNRRHPVSPGPVLRKEHANIVVLVLQFVCDALVSCEKQINLIDSESGNGNIGSKIRCGVEIILLEAKKKTLDFDHPRLLFDRLSTIAEKSICGAIGSLYSILFEAASNTFKDLSDKHDINVYTWLDCLMNASQAIKSYGNTEYGLGTMYDPLYACALAIEESLKKEIRPLEALESGVSTAEEAALRSRKPYKKSPDPGAHVVGIWMRALLEGIKMRCD